MCLRGKLIFSNPWRYSSKRKCNRECSGLIKLYHLCQFMLVLHTSTIFLESPSQYEITGKALHLSLDAIFPRILLFLHPLLYLNFILHPLLLPLFLLLLLLLLLLLDSLSLMQPRAGPEGRTPTERSPLAPHYVTLLSTIPQKLLNRSGRNLIQYFKACPCIIVQNFRKIWFYKVFGFLVTFGVWTLPAARCGSSYSEEDMAKENQCFISAPPNSVKSSERRQVGVTHVTASQRKVWHRSWHHNDNCDRKADRCKCNIGCYLALDRTILI